MLIRQIVKVKAAVHLSYLQLAIDPLRHISLLRHPLEQGHKRFAMCHQLIHFGLVQ